MMASPPRAAAHATAQRPRWRAPEARAQGVGQSGFVVFLVSHLTWILVGAAVMAHVLLADDAYPLMTRVFIAVPAVVLLLEGRAYIKAGARELPIGIWALAQYYLAFSFPVFFDLPFFTLAGPVSFTSETYLVGGMVVALGSLSMWAGIRLGLGAGNRLHGFVRRAVPPTEIPAGWDNAFVTYAGVGIAMSVLTIFVNLPAGVQLPVNLIFGAELALGIALAVPLRRFGGRTPLGLALSMGILGLLRGMLTPMMAAGATYLAGRWLNTRRFALRVAVLCVILYAAFQPVKESYRKRTWVHETGAADQVSIGDRFRVWAEAFEGAYSGAPASSSSDNQPLVGRLSNLGPVFNACQVVPSRIEYLMGSSFVQIVYMTIPRIIWAEKPTTQDLYAQRYAVIFGLQDEMGSRYTAIGLPLLVEGWWNFGWAGVALVGVLAGLWAGTAQRTFSGEHWAMRALGYAYFSQAGAADAVVNTYQALFQFFVGRMIAIWGVYWFAQVLSARSRRAFVRRPAGRPARMGRALPVAGGAAPSRVAP